MIWEGIPHNSTLDPLGNQLAFVSRPSAERRVNWDLLGQPFARDGRTGEQVPHCASDRADL